MRRRRFLGAIGALLTTWIARQEAGAQAWPDPEEPTSTGFVGYADIELDIFSGRPNPMWTVEAEAISPFLPAGAEAVEPIEPPGLGYRGFLITYVSAETGVPVSIRVYGGRVTIGEPGEQHTYGDALGLEAWLVGLASSHGYGALLECIPPARCS